MSSENINCDHDCNNCKPIDCDEYFGMSEGGKERETDRAICRISRKVRLLISAPEGWGSVNE